MSETSNLSLYSKIQKQTENVLLSKIELYLQNVFKQHDLYYDRYYKLQQIIQKKIHYKPRLEENNA